MSETKLRSEIRQFVEVISGAGDRFGDADDLIDRGIVKSINLLEIITWLEDNFGCIVHQRDVFEGHFRSVDRMVAFVGRGHQ